jgi:hypothetical protein
MACAGIVLLSARPFKIGVHLTGPDIGNRDVLDLEGVRGRAMPHDSNCLHGRRC